MKRVEEYLQGYDFEKFKKDYKTVDAVIRNFEIIGEASKNIAAELKKSHPGIPWDEMYRLRNRISHEYFGIDYEIIWNIATKYLPKNQKDILIVLESVRNNNKE